MDHADDDNDDDVFVYMGGEIPQHLRETITHVRVHKSVKIITREAFKRCRNLVSIEMHNGVEIIEKLSFWACHSLRRIKLPGVKVTGERAFAGCRALENVEFGDKLETIGRRAFQSTSLRKIQLPKVRAIGIRAFTECEQLTEVELSEDLEVIEEGAFEDCPNLRRVALPLKDNLLDVEEDFEDDDAFTNCANLSQVDLIGGIHKTISSLLLDSWKNEMNDEIDSINRDLPNTRHYEKTVLIQQWMERVIRRIEHYISEHYALLKEFTILLELALWKAKLDESQDERSLGSNQPAKKVRVDTKASRQEQRITSGASIVIKNVLPFLGLE